MPAKCKLAIGRNGLIPVLNNVQLVVHCRQRRECIAIPSRFETGVGGVGAPLQAFECLLEETGGVRRIFSQNVLEQQAVSGGNLERRCQVDGGVARTQLEAEIDRCRMSGRGEFEGEPPRLPVNGNVDEGSDLRRNGNAVIGKRQLLPSVIAENHPHESPFRSRAVTDELPSDDERVAGNDAVVQPGRLAA